MVQAMRILAARGAGQGFQSGVALKAGLLAPPGSFTRRGSCPICAAICRGRETKTEEGVIGPRDPVRTGTKMSPFVRDCI